MPSKPTIRSARAAATLTSNLMLAPAVIAMRLPLLEAEARGSSLNRVETNRAVSEKMTAVMEGAFAAQMSLMQAAMQFWPEVLSGRKPSLLSGAAMEQAMRAAWLPSANAVRSNHRRLGRKR